MSSHKYDGLFKILILGESDVGKTCLLLRYTDNSLKANHLTTIGIDFKIKTINIENRIIKLQIWDTVGQERFRTFSRTYYKLANGIILTYDITDKNSFLKIPNWIKQIEANAPKNVKKILVGNKTDKIDTLDRVVTEEEGKKLAKDYNMHFFETSAKTGQNVTEAFDCLIKEIMKEQGIIKIEQEIVLKEKNNKEEEKGCYNENKNKYENISNNKDKNNKLDYESQINELKNQLDEEKNKNIKLIYEIKIMKKSLDELKKKLDEEKNKSQILDNENKKLIAQINQSNSENDKNIIKILEEKNKLLKSELENYKSESKEITSIKPGEKIIAVNFLSMGIQDIINYCLPCKNTDLFVRLEEKLYQDFPQFKDYETYFEVKTRRIKKFKTIDENKINCNDIISVFIIDN